MISHAHRCVFVHVPKTAGQSVESYFLNLIGLTWEQREELLLRPNQDPAAGPERLAHLFAREYVDLGYIGPEEFQRYFTFAFVRNPWARLVSEYQYRFEGRMSFSSFVKRSIPVKETFSDFARHIVPQHEYLYDAEGGQMVDFVGRFENLAEDFAEVCARLGLQDAKLPYRNKSAGAEVDKTWTARIRRSILGKPQRKPWREYYDAPLRDIVGEYYSVDIERFGYDFELMTKQDLPSAPDKSVRRSADAR